jgi:hypothetical protein
LRIDPFGIRKKNALCKRQWAEWLAISILDQRFRDAIDLMALLFWNVIAMSSRWRVLENMLLLLSLSRPQKRKMKGPFNSEVRYPGAWSKVQKRSHCRTNSGKVGEFDRRTGNLKESKSL